MKKIIFKEIQEGNDKIGLELDYTENFTILLPKYYISNEKINELNSFNNKIDDNTKNKIKKLFKAWDIYQKRNKSMLGAKFNNNKEIYDLNTSFELIKDFIEQDLYIEQEDAIKITNTGKMNFKKTINHCNPLYTKQGPVYLDYITNIKKPNDQNFIRLTQITILNEISKDFGWIIGFNYNFQIAEKIKLNKRTVQTLTEKLDKAYNTRKIHLLNLLIKYINNKSNDLMIGKKLFVGMANHFWEDMINYVIGNVSKADLKKFFYVKHYYVENDSIHALPPLMPDSIYKDPANIVVIDSKYYVNNYLPDNDDINKQYIYFLKTLLKFKHYENFGNCFILPTDEESHVSNKEVKFDIDTNANQFTIKLIYANVNEIIEFYTSNKKNQELINSLITAN